jgi:hypothetical protein
MTVQAIHESEAAPAANPKPSLFLGETCSHGIRDSGPFGLGLARWLGRWDMQIRIPDSSDVAVQTEGEVESRRMRTVGIESLYRCSSQCHTS